MFCVANLQSSNREVKKSELLFIFEMEKNCNSSDPIPTEFVELLFGDVESDLEEDGDLGLELSGESDIDDSKVEDMPIVLKNEDGSMAPISLLVDYQLSSDDEDAAEDCEAVRSSIKLTEEVHCLSPLTPKQSVPSPSQSTPQPEPLSVRAVSVSTAGRARAVRGRRGRWCSPRAYRRAGCASYWTRGQPLSERYMTDEEVPAEIREQIIEQKKLWVRRTLDVEEEDDESEVEALPVSSTEVPFTSTDQHFDWKPVGEWEGGQKEVFRPPRAPGPQRLFTSAYDTFRAIWNDEILSKIVDATNCYAATIKSEVFQREWYPTTIDELMILLAFWMLLGIIHMPTIKSCYSKLPLLRTEVFRNLLTEKRYWNLNRAFHLASGTSQDNPLQPMGPVLDHLNERFQELYQLSQDICIDESLTLWKGPIKFRQYIKTKAAKYGIKTYQLCESSTGYLWSFFVYCGKSSTTSSATTVLRLVRPVLGIGHVLYMDNYFNSPLLARYLKKQGTDCVGTLRASRKNLPAEVCRVPLRDGEFIARQCGDILVIDIMDSRRFEVISTCHGLSQVQTVAKPGRKAQYKFSLIVDYNSGMGGVDRLDQMLEPYLVERKQCRKWTKKLFKRLLNMSIQNSRILLEKSSSRKIDSLLFRLSLAQEIVDNHLVNSTGQKVYTERTHTFPLTRLTERHFIHRIPITEDMKQNIKHKSNMGRKYCVLCSYNGNRSKTSYWCPKCKLPLCLDECFEKFHTVVKL